MVIPSYVLFKLAYHIISPKKTYIGVCFGNVTKIGEKEKKKVVMLLEYVAKN